MQRDNSLYTLYDYFQILPFSSAEISRHCRHAIASTSRTLRLINDSLFVGTVDIVIVENTTRLKLIHGVEFIDPMALVCVSIERRNRSRCVLHNDH